MKNLLKILLILAFSAPVFASSTTTTTTTTFDTTVTTDQIKDMSTDAQKAWVNSLLAAPNAPELYNNLNSDVQKWVVENTTADQQKVLGLINNI
ncbi:hypothetical protein BA173_01690 [Rickettsia sp. MEAM1 (Bemisia tabaci)]|nr:MULTISPECIES: DUF2673 domain-containing protein [unclassified Rickettsia]ASX27618.1 hypothetical protein BA173_01690 [Rickettsia sp. MEAM1 (Bemisia tabaci)]ODA37519.1 hypothetical protein A8V33_05725 [Rickettsia sp. wb]ODA37709.1 hypothetical protein A8V34_02840 [Rickettsia sp. wq]